MTLDLNDDLDRAYHELKSQEKDRHSKLVSRLRDMEEETEQLSNTSTIAASAFLPSSMLTGSKIANEDKPVDRTEEAKPVRSDEYGYMYDKAGYDPDLWFDDLVSFSSPKANGKSGRKHMFDGEGIIGKKKKKKKEKTSDGVALIDFKKEFEPDIALFRNLLKDQNKFTDSLQKQYDDLNRVKSTARGVNKTMTDLVENITQARSLSMQLIEKNVQAKKLIAELTMKQKKEFGSAAMDSPDAMNDFASNYLRTMLDNKRAIMDPTNADIVDMDDEMLFDELEASILEDGVAHTEDADKFLRYENQKVQVWVHIFQDENGNDDIDNYIFEAYDENGDYIDDYPEPLHTKISINRSTNIATDKYGKKYHIKWY